LCVLRRPTKYRPSGPKLPPPGFRPSIRPVSRTTRPSEEIAKTRLVPLFRNSRSSFESTARPRRSAMRSSIIKIPRRVPFGSTARSEPNPLPLAPAALVTRRNIGTVLRSLGRQQGYLHRDDCAVCCQVSLLHSGGDNETACGTNDLAGDPG